MPFFLRTGKRLSRKTTEIAVQLKPVPHLAFASDGSVGVQPNLLILAVQPNEGVSLSLGAKIPGSRMRIRPVNMEFLYGSSFMSQSPEAYERLIQDAMRGEATLFTRDDEVIAQWSIIDPILKAWQRGQAAADQLRRPARPGRPRPTSCSRRASGAACDRDAMSQEVWRERDTTPSKIEAALRNLLIERYHDEDAFVPARVLNLVVVVDGEFRGEVENRLERVGRYHPSRLVLCSVEPRRTTIDAWCSVAAEKAEGPFSLGRETVELTLGERHLKALDTIVDPLLVPDLATLVWAPHGHAEAVDSLRRLMQVVLVDSQDEQELPAALARSGELLESAYVVDLAWLRSTPWRERVAAAFDPPPLRRGLAEISARHGPPPRGLGRRGGAVLRLAVLAPGLAPGLALGRRLRAPHRPRPRAPRRGHAAPRRGRAARRPRPRRRDDRDGLGRVALARPRAGRAQVRPPRPRRHRAGLDRARRIARRGGDPRRGRAPGAAARPDLQAGALSRARDGRVGCHLACGRSRSSRIPGPRSPSG